MVDYVKLFLILTFAEVRAASRIVSADQSLLVVPRVGDSPYSDGLEPTTFRCKGMSGLQPDV